jgi:23S rRNA pseudouridine2604 synthase
VRIFPIGRLDKDSQGLIFLTNNGDLVNKVLRAGNNHEKEYVVTVNKPITDKFIQGMAGGVPILGTMTKKCPVEKLAPFVFNIRLVQGLNRQIRRMCEHFGYEVVKLERTRIMNVSLNKLPVGEWRDLTEKELGTLLKSVEHSSSEAKPGTKKRGHTPRKSNAAGASKARASQGQGKERGAKQPAKTRAGASSQNPPGRGRTNTTSKAAPGARGAKQTTKGPRAGKPSSRGNSANNGTPKRPSRRR